MKPITAEEARKLVTTFHGSLASKFITDIYSLIVASAENGLSHLVVELDNRQIDGPTLNQVIVKLTELGYTAKHSSGSDCRAGDSWNNLNISW
jgi:hypothetical protein